MKCGECTVSTTNPKDKTDCYFCPFDKVDAFHSLHDCSHLSELVEKMAELLKEQQAVIEQLRNDANARRCKDCKYHAPDMCCNHPIEWNNGESRNHCNPNWFCADFDPSDEAVLEAFAEDG